MSADRSTAESECSTSGSPSQDGNTPGSASPMNSGATSSASAGPESRSTPTSEDLPLLPTPEAAARATERESRAMGEQRGRRIYAPNGTRRYVDLADVIHAQARSIS